MIPLTIESFIKRKHFPIIMRENQLQLIKRNWGKESETCKSFKLTGL